MNVLFIGDVFGKPGRHILHELLPKIKQTYAVDVVIVNGENAAGGFGITPDIAEEFSAWGVDMITSGNHIWKKPAITEYMGSCSRVLRPINMSKTSPGKGIGIVRKANLPAVAVINAIGRVFMDHSDCPFRATKAALDELDSDIKIIIVDFHAEATSEKRVMGWYLDGKVSAVLGTHTHIQTADEEILPKGTGYLTDVGMTGPHDSVIGVEKETIIQKFLTQMPSRFSPATNGVQLNGVVLQIDDNSGRCTDIRRLRVTCEKEIQM